ncbi:MAG: hypothetical protein NC393_09535 [Clostridium sp.]|nr:hypothetical protein [Clostridium sp.]MCM1172354.1 hypothetical protein [Clostridium sp.]
MEEYKITIPHFYQLEYTEGNHKMYLDIDFRDPEIYLEVAHVEHWEKPFENEIISESEKNVLYIMFILVC